MGEEEGGKGEKRKKPTVSNQHDSDEFLHCRDVCDNPSTRQPITTDVNRGPTPWTGYGKVDSGWTAAVEEDGDDGDDDSVTKSAVVPPDTERPSSDSRNSRTAM